MDKKALIRKFLDNKCNDEEGALVEKMLRDEPRLLDELLTLDEWDAQPGDLVNIHNNRQLKSEIWQRVDAITGESRTFPNYRKLFAIAASVLILIVTGFYLNDLKQGPGRAETAKTVDALQVASNTSMQLQEVSFPDGSAVTLYPGAAISYYADFTRDRNITLLSGKAAFNVAKGTNPFAVHSGDIITTALGTKFVVNHAGDKVNVQLFEGKVLVKTVHESVGIPATILYPGKQCVANTKMDNLIILSLGKTGFNEVLQNQTAIAKKKYIGIGDGLSFYNVPLKETFDQVEQLFGKEIVYNPGDVEKMFFTGQFTENDSLENILNVLANINHLIVKRAGDKIIISKNHELENGLHGNDLVHGGNDAALHGKANNGKITSGKSYVNESLSVVFDGIEKEFDINIRYDKQELKDKYFTGLISSEDSVKHILTIICRMNNLQIVEKPGGYLIMK